jgi:hypothetical protein
MVVNLVLFIRQHKGKHKVKIALLNLTCLTPDSTLNLKENYLAHLFNIKQCFILHKESYRVLNHIGLDHMAIFRTSAHRTQCHCRNV